MISSMRRLFPAISIMVALASPMANAGSGPAKLVCKAADGGRVLTLSGKIPATEDDLDLTLSDGKATLVMGVETADAHVVEAFEHKVFTLIVARKGAADLALYAIPTSVKAKKAPNSARATFDAVLEAPKPDHPGPATYDSVLHRVKMACTYEYSI